ncbi:MAG TPA: reverse transcriptase family protein, partial [Methylomicrobium sp.]|nr:reverse transcriptase family protein [Methylomicrobium sp.]
MSEAVFPVKADKTFQGPVALLEGNGRSPCHALMVARAAIDPRNEHIPCRVLNPTQDTITLRKGTCIGTLSPVASIAAAQSTSVEATQTPPVSEMRSTLENMGISFDTTSVTGNDLDTLIKLLYDNRDVMATSIKDLPGCDVMKMHIDTGDHPPVRSRGFRHSPADRAEISRQVKEMLDAGVVQESDSPWQSPVILVRKKDSTQRFVIDYRKLNSITALTSFPLPTITDVFDVVADQKPTLFTSLDLRSGYWQTALDEQSYDKTAFQTHDGCFEFKRVSFGLCSAVQFFQMVMQKVLKGLTQDSVLVYLDDILVLAPDAPTMNHRLEQIFQRFRDARLRLHPAKCVWATDRVKFLGHVFDRRGISVDTSKFDLIRNYPVCKTPKQVRSFLGLTGYYRRFVQAYSQKSALLRALLKADTPF